MLDERIPRIKLHLVLPERPAFCAKRILWWELYGSDGLVGCSCFIPDYTAVFCRVVRWVCTKLDLTKYQYL